MNCHTVLIVRFVNNLIDAYNKAMTGLTREIFGW